MKTFYTQDLELIRQADVRKEAENDQFRHFLQHQDEAAIDSRVSMLNKEVSAAIDCTLCGNCCRSLMINVAPGEAGIVAAHLGISTTSFMENFIEESQQGQLIINTIPCHFLAGNKCTIYETRFKECREFPHLHKPRFVANVFMFFMHYNRCPIIFNVIEQLKIDLSFVKS